MQWVVVRRLKLWRVLLVGFGQLELAESTRMNALRLMKYVQFRSMGCLAELAAFVRQVVG